MSVTSRAEGIQIEEFTMTLEICIAINNEGVFYTIAWQINPANNSKILYIKNKLQVLFAAEVTWFIGLLIQRRATKLHLFFYL